MASVKGMVQVAGTTYRICRTSGHYEAIRILDDQRVGTFITQPKLSITSTSIEPPIMMEIALCAMKKGHTSWTGRLFVQKT